MKKIGYKKQPRDLVVVFSRHSGTRMLANLHELTERTQKWLSASFGTRFTFLEADPSKWSMRESLEKMSR